MAKTEEKQDLRIIGFKADGIRKITAVEMEFSEDGLFQIKGKNRVGKTTILHVIEWLIKGNKMLNKDIIQHGKDKATGELRLGKYVITRSATLKSQRLEVRNTETNTVMTGEVQNFLNTFVNELTFNSKSFLNKTPLEQLRFCFELFGIDFTEIDKELQTLEKDRLICGREVNKFGDLDESKPEKVAKVDVGELFQERKHIELINAGLSTTYLRERDAEIEKIEAFNKEQRERKSAIDEHDKKIQDNFTKITETEQLIKEMEDKLTALKNGLDARKQYSKKMVEELTKLPKPEPEKPLVADIPEPTYQSTQEIDVQIQNATAQNQKAELYEKWFEKKKEKAEKQSEYSAYDTKIDVLRKKKIDILTGINTGVEGLEIREDGLYYKGIYSENWSDMESIRIASELCMAQNPQLKAIFVDRFESFDKDSREDFNRWAKERGIQVIVTKVEDEIPADVDEPNVFYIENGSVVKNNNGNGKATKKQVEELA